MDDSDSEIDAPAQGPFRGDEDMPLPLYASHGLLGYYQCALREALARLRGSPGEDRALRVHIRGLRLGILMLRSLWLDAPKPLAGGSPGPQG